MSWLKWLFSSKKRTAAVVAVLLATLHPLLEKVGFQLTSGQVEIAVQVIAAYILGQGLADLGKDAQLPPGT